MRNTAQLLQRFITDETGATMVEYGLMVALISVALISTVNAMTGGLKATFASVTTALQNAAS